MELFSGDKSPETLEYLLGRRSVMAKNLVAPAPDKDQLATILQAASRVPDHGKLSPWYFIVFEGGHREVIGKKIHDIYVAENPDATDKQKEVEQNRFTKAPLVVAVISRIRNGKPAMWEQILSSGASCMNLILAANASGFAAHWVTEWYAYNNDFHAYLGLDARDNVAGFIHIGTPSVQPSERLRPELKEIVTNWQEGLSLNKGDVYNSKKFGVPEQGVDLSGVEEDG